jgi:DNA-directed RNA polymerase subunit RPC12/RpoP
VRTEIASTVVVCGHCGVRFSTSVPRDIIESLRRCGDCGERALVIETGANGAGGDTGRTRRDEP